MRNNNRKINTYCTIAGVEDCDVLVEVDISPPEPDVNWAGGLDICSVWFEDQGCQLDRMSEEEIANLQERIEGDLSDKAEAEYYDRADHAYEQRKDLAAEIRQETLAQAESQRGVKI